jgi:hypothetical protein
MTDTPATTNKSPHSAQAVDLGEARAARAAEAAVLSEAAARLLRGTRAREDEDRKRQRLEAELATQLSQPLVASSPAHTAESIAARKPKPRPPLDGWQARERT